MESRTELGALITAHKDAPFLPRIKEAGQPYKDEIVKKRAEATHLMVVAPKPIDGEIAKMFGREINEIEFLYKRTLLRWK